MSASQLVRVEQAMTPEERKAFLKRFVGMNPHWQGAGVADILSVLADSDSNLSVTEKMYEEHHSEVGEPGLLTTTTLAVLYTYGEVTWDSVHKLLMRYWWNVLPKGTS